MAESIPFKTTMEFTYGEPKELVAGVSRIVANNPSPFTFKGTNTYLVGTGASLAVIDPGPEDAAHLQAILAAAGKRRITHIVVTHTHRDHVDGLPSLKDATGAVTVGFGRTARERGARRTSPSGTEFVDNDFRPDIALADGDTIADDSWALTALHTPGHAPDHHCYALAGTSVLFSGDHVMSWNTSVVAPPEGNMGDYMRSLEKLIGRTDDLYLPGHGGQLTSPVRVAKAFAVHRRAREQSILECIRSGARDASEIVPRIYPELDSKLVNAATLSVLAHIEHLKERGLVTYAGPLDRQSDLSAA